MKPVLFVTGHVPAYRVGALARLHEREGIELALFGGRSQHGGAGLERTSCPFPIAACARASCFALAAQRRLPRGRLPHRRARSRRSRRWAGARRAALAADPVGLAVGASAQRSRTRSATSPLRRLYRSADAVVTYGPHVSAYVQARGARNVHVAPQSVDNDFWRAPQTPRRRAGWPADAERASCSSGATRPRRGSRCCSRPGALAERRRRPTRWRSSGWAPVPRPSRPRARGRGDAGIVSLGALAPAALRDVYAAGDVLVVPSVATRTFREPWGLVVNEAMNRGLP